ncbi:MAG: response regulator [Desulfobulbaceae bacterium]
MTDSIRILMVEDLPADAELMEREVRRVLPRSEFMLVETREDFLAALESFRPEIILSDFMLPDFDGMRALHLALEKVPETPFILVTGSMNEETAVECMKAGAWDYIVKEHLRRLGPAILNALERRRQRRARKSAEEALAASEAEFRRLSQEFHGLLDAIPDNLTLIDRNMQIRWVNSAALKEFGNTRAEELIGQSCFVMRHNGTEPCPDCPVAESFATGKPAGLVRTMPDGRIWDLRTIPLLDDDGFVSRVIELGRDITDHRKLEAQLRQAQKMESVGRLAGGIAHDFNNMLTVMIGYGEQLMSQLETDDPVRRDIGEMVKAARRSADLTRQLLAFSRQQAILPQVVDLNERIGSSLKMLKRLVGEDIDLRFAPGENLDRVRIDLSQIEQILANLTVNARDAIAGTGLIRIETANVVLDESYCAYHEGFIPGEYVMVSFSDSGYGIDQEVLPNIFEPFFTTKEEGKGTGLGLSTVYGIVKQNSGFINVYSEPGRGTTFRIYFPPYCGPAARQQETRAEAVRGGTETLLLVEDEIQILAMCKRLLEKQGYRVLAAGSPEEALALCGQFQGKIDLLVSDLIMPNMNGSELFAQISRLKPGIKVLIMSGYTADIISKRGGLAEGGFFIQKPFTNKDFISKVRQVLSQ